MRSLVVTLDRPVQASGGAGIRNAQTIRSLSRHGPVDVAALAVTSDGPTDGADVTLCWSREELRQGRTIRDALLERTWRLRPTAHWRQEMYRSAEALRTVRNLVEERRHDLVVAASWQAAGYLEGLRGRSRLVLDTHNVEADLQRDLGGSGRSGRPPADVRRLAVCERRAGRTVDQVWVCSHDDERLWQSVHHSTAPVHVVPNVVGVGRHPHSSSERVRGQLLLTGTFSYPPNIAAARELVQDVLPLVRRTLPEAGVLIVGREPAPCVLELAAPRVAITGAVHDVRPYLEQASVMVVPLRSGGGTRLKILEAMASGLPVVSTTKGAEGLDVEDGVHLLIADTTAGLAAAAERLCTDRTLALALSAAGRQLVTARYSEIALDRAVDDAIGKVGLP